LPTPEVYITTWKQRKDGVNSERHPVHEEHHGRVKRVLDGVEAGDVRLGNHQEVARVDRVGVKHDDEAAVLVHTVTGQIAVDKVAEQAIGARHLIVVAHAAPLGGRDYSSLYHEQHRSAVHGAPPRCG
jgi:hypothetical protein